MAEVCWLAASIVICKLGLAIGLGFFLLCVHSVLLFLTFVR